MSSRSKALWACAAAWLALPGASPLFAAEETLVFKRKITLEDCAVERPTDAIKLIKAGDLADAKVRIKLTLTGNVRRSGAPDTSGLLVQYDGWMFQKGAPPFELFQGEMKQVELKTLPFDARALRGRNVYVRIRVVNVAEYAVQLTGTITVEQEGKAVIGSEVKGTTDVLGPALVGGTKLSAQAINAFYCFK
jgi:hypothetical protein